MGDSANQWPEIITAAAAVAGLIFVGAQVRQAGRATALGVAQNFVSRAADLWGDCIEASNLSPGALQQQKFAFSVSQILAHFELSTIYLVDFSSTDNIRRMVEETLVDHISLMANNGYHNITIHMFTDPSVCRHLRDFCLQRRDMFKNYRAVSAMMVLPEHSR